MKLIHPACGKVESMYREVGGYTPNFIARLFGAQDIPGKLVPNPNLGNRKVLTNATIDFEATPFIPNDTYYEDVAFGNQLYEGIRPVKHLRDNVYECSVNNIRQIRIENEYEPPEEYR